MQDVQNNSTILPKKHFVLSSILVIHISATPHKHGIQTILHHSHASALDPGIVLDIALPRHEQRLRLL